MFVFQRDWRIQLRKANYFIYLVKKILDKPLWVLFFCAFLASANTILDGTLFRIWNLYASGKILDRRIATLEKKNIFLEERLKKLSDSKFLEKEVRDRFDLVNEKDLVFIFSEEDEDWKEKHKGTEKK